MDLISLLVYLVIAALIFYLIYWILTKIPLPEPWGVVIQVVVGLIAVIFLIGLLTGYVPTSFRLGR